MLRLVEGLQWCDVAVRTHLDFELLTISSTPAKRTGPHRHLKHILSRWSGSLPTWRRYTLPAMENLWTKMSGICSVAILKGSKFLSHCRLPSFFLKYRFTKIHQQMKLQHVVFQMTGEKPKQTKNIHFKNMKTDQNLITVFKENP